LNGLVFKDLQRGLASRIGINNRREFRTQTFLSLLLSISLFLPPYLSFAALSINTRSNRERTIGALFVDSVFPLYCSIVVYSTRIPPTVKPRADMIKGIFRGPALRVLLIVGSLCIKLSVMQFLIGFNVFSISNGHFPSFMLRHSCGPDYVTCI
jgi:hypothetical protein